MTLAWASVLTPELVVVASTSFVGAARNLQVLHEIACGGSVLIQLEAIVRDDLS